jgi:exonuclease III
MTLSLATINVNGLRDKKKRDLVFNWLVAKIIDVICLQETQTVDEKVVESSQIGDACRLKHYR